MKLRINIAFPALVMFILLSCQQQPEEKGSHGELTEITTAQFTNDSMRMGRAETRVFEELVNCSGYLVPLPGAHASVSLPLKGIIAEVRCAEGQRVDKGYGLLEVSGHDLIDLQKDFTQVAAEFKRQKTSYERISTLFKDNVVSQKEFQAAESDFHAARASYAAMKLKIESLGLKAGAVENGEFSPVYHVSAPIPGIISKMSVMLGKNTGEDFPLLEITDPSNLKLKLNIFPGDIPKLFPGQGVRYQYPGDPAIRDAVISRIGNVLCEDSKTVTCYASPMDKNTNNHVVNAFVEAQVIVNKDSALAVPAEAILKSGDHYYIFVFDHQGKEVWYFKRVQVIPGKTNGHYTEIPGLTGEEEILVRGVYNLHAE